MLHFSGRFRSHSREDADAALNARWGARQMHAALGESRLAGLFNEVVLSIKSAAAL